MRTFATTSPTNDFLVSGRTLVLASDIDAVLLVCRHCAQAILEEMVFAKDQGMPYFETVWIGAPTTAPFEAAFRDRIMRVDGVTGIEELTAAQVGDKMQYSAVIATAYGTGVLNG
jgi:hypothetical protein